jgi:hypothetical protein
VSAKQLPPPTGTDRLADVLRRRHEPTPPADPPTQEPAPTPRAPTSAQAREATPRAQSMDRRSWYMPKETAEALADAVADVHWQSHRPKHEVLAAIVGVALTHLDEVQARLNTQP